jgi:biotin carboxyl carrier protein
MATPPSQAGGTLQQEPEEARSLVPAPPRQAGVDRFDDAIVVTRTRAWIGLAACLALVAGVVVWAAAATVSKTVTGSGVVLVNGTITQIESPVTGTVVGWRVGAGFNVRDSEVMGWVQTSANQRVPVRAPVAGKVLIIIVGEGASVTRGQNLASLTATHGPLAVAAFLKPADAQLVGSRMRAMVNLPDGSVIDASVVSVGQLPLTTGEVASIIGSPALAQLVKPAGSAIALLILPKDEKAAKRMANAGDVATVTVIVGSSHPIQYIF